MSVLILAMLCALHYPSCFTGSQTGTPRRAHGSELAAWSDASCVQHYSSSVFQHMLLQEISRMPGRANAAALSFTIMQLKQMNGTAE